MVSFRADGLAGQGVASEEVRPLRTGRTRAAAQAERGELVDGEEFITQLLAGLKDRARKPGAA